jgi:hypothetical protein
MDPDLDRRLNLVNLNSDFQDTDFLLFLLSLRWATELLSYVNTQ